MEGEARNVFTPQEATEKLCPRGVEMDGMCAGPRCMWWRWWNCKLGYCAGTGKPEKAKE